MSTPTQSHPAEMAHTLELVPFRPIGGEEEYALHLAPARPQIGVVFFKEQAKEIQRRYNSHHAQQAAIRQLREALGATMQTALIHGAIEQEFGPARSALAATKELAP